jgi:sulfotransferase
MKEYYFISGLPRSGSTLLSGILKQNPEFYADIASPVLSIVTGTIDSITFSENNFNINDDQREAILKHIFEGYYSKIDRPVVFDSSRTWTAKTPLLQKLFPYTKIICCVRDICWILDSFERIAAKNPYYTNTLIEAEVNQCVTTRCESLMDPTKGGQVIKPWFWLQEGMAMNSNMIHLVEYSKLCKKPEETMKGIYNFIGKPYYNHDFDNVEYNNELFDLKCNLKDLHTVKQKVEYVERKTILPEEVWNKYSSKNFWKEPIGKYG